jgi:hypothetical protein
MAWKFLTWFWKRLPSRRPSPPGEGASFAAFRAQRALPVVSCSSDEKSKRRISTEAPELSNPCAVAPSLGGEYLLRVAQVSNLLYRSASSLQRFEKPNLRAVRTPADWKSAIQQVGNLRYECFSLSRAEKLLDG